ncbi:MAG: tandem-95 repeat protein [Chryseolinea sp.]
MRARLLLLYCIFLTAPVQLVANLKPIITGQKSLSTKENSPITIQLTDLFVLDLDDQYPEGFTLIISAGNNYTFQGDIVTPSANFTGNLKVSVKVNDGEDDSKRYDLKITVVNNVQPVVTGQDAIQINEGESFAVRLSHLKVSDSDNVYPTDFTLNVFSGTNYSVNGNTITPTPAFAGELTVQVSIDDGIDESNTFDLKIEVIEVANIIPEIIGQNSLTAKEDGALTLTLGDLTVKDPDNSYPAGFTLKMNSGTNYTVSGFTISPTLNFFGTLSVPVTVNDGSDDSPLFMLQISITPVNDLPVITAQVPLSTDKNVPFTLQLSHLTVVDPDNKYPEDFTLSIATGTNYTVSGNIITPASDFTGTLNANVMVHDGTANSLVFKVKIDVLVPVNAKPVITGQQLIGTNANRSVAIKLTDLIVSDPDNLYPDDFTMVLSAGVNYTISGMVITPTPDFTGTLTVQVTVNDGANTSAPFNLKILVLPGNDSAPLITGQTELRMNEDESITLKFADLTVEDKDNSYPTGFTMNVAMGNHYKNSGLTITPDLDFNGYLVVGVTVNDGKNTSPVFNLAILINPVNDPPQIIEFETAPLSYDPGNGAVGITEIFDLADVDNETLNFAEIGIRPDGYSEANDVLVFNNTAKIRGLYDAHTGILSLIGIATVSEYRDAIRSVQYDQTPIEEGNDLPVGLGPKMVYINVNDGQDVSLTKERAINFEALLLDIPTGFTPNGDHANDTWEIRTLTSPQQFRAVKVKVYNQRGKMVYETTTLDNGWDGVLDGNVLPADSYFFTIELETSYVKKNFKGVVTLLR